MAVGDWFAYDVWVDDVSQHTACACSVRAVAATAAGQIAISVDGAAIGVVGMAGGTWATRRLEARSGWGRDRIGSC